MISPGSIRHIISNSAYHLVPARYTDQITERIWFQANKSLLFNKRNINISLILCFIFIPTVSLSIFFTGSSSSRWYSFPHTSLIFAEKSFMPMISHWSTPPTQVSLMSSACSAFYLISLPGYSTNPNLNCPKWTSVSVKPNGSPSIEFSMHFDELLSHFLFLSQDCRQWACVFSPVPGMVPGIW